MLAPSWGHLRGYGGPSSSYVGPSRGYVGPSWGYVGPACGPCCPVWGLCWASVRAFWAYVGPCCLVLIHKIENKVRWYPQQPQRFAKLSAGNTSAGFPWDKWPLILLNLNWLCTKASQTFSGTFSGTLLNLTRSAPKPPGTFSGTFSGALSGTLLNITWLCIKASHLFRNLLRNAIEPDLALHQSLPDILRNPIELNLAATKLRNPVELNLAAPKPACGCICQTLLSEPTRN